MENTNSFLGKLKTKIQKSLEYTVTLKKEYKLITRLENYSNLYDAQEHSIELSVKDGCNVEYSLDNQSWSSEKPCRLHPEVLTVYVRVSKRNRIELGNATLAQGGTGTIK